MSQECIITQVLPEPKVWQKLENLQDNLRALLCGERLPVPETPGRDVQIWPIRALPKKKGLSSAEGQARLLHDLASIELQAMELALRTLIEYPEAPPRFREQLADITFEEGEHLRLCLQGLEALNFPWGSFPTHLGLWMCVRSADSLLDRVLIVHRYLEGSGLDASHTLLRRLEGVKASEVLGAVRVIGRDEVGHVKFGSEWYRILVREQGLDPDRDFTTRLQRLAERLPRRLEPIQHDLRLSAGFSLAELAALDEHRLRILTPPSL
jgi:uncharacterized ferritin-like protein (DUF455 family)